MTLARSIAALHDAFRRGETLPSAVLADAWRRIARSPLNAVADLDRAGAEAAAVESDRRVHGGAMRALEGVTVGIKSNIAVAGLSWTAGMALRRDIVATADAACVARLRAAGAVVIGTLGMHEAALGATSDNAWYGRIGNPHRDGVSPGGSSGGSGAAVAAGLCHVALGTDTLGSVRIPAAYTGVYGLKPTNGAIGDDGLFALDVRLDAIGPLARSLDDLAAVWTVLGPTPPPAAAARRLVVLADIGEVEPAVQGGYDRAMHALASLARDQLVLVDSLRAIRRAGLVQAGRALVAALGPARTDQAATISPELHAVLDFALRTAPQPEVLARTCDAMRDALGDDGVLLLPTAPHAAFRHGEAPVTQADFTALANIAGLPALALPAGRDAAGLPVGVQVVAPAGHEAMAFAVAATLDDALAGYAAPSD